MAKEEQIKSQIILDGEKEYKSACKGINASLREIGSEMKLVTAEFSGNADSVEALAKKQEVLQKQLEEQAKKAGAAEEALKKMREGGVDPTSIAFKKMQTNLNNAKADMAKTQAEINGITDSLPATSPSFMLIPALCTAVSDFMSCVREKIPSPHRTSFLVLQTST